MPINFDNPSRMDDRVLGEDNAEQIANHLVTKEGDVLGGLFKLPKPLQIAYQIFIPEIKDKISDFGADAVLKYGEPALKAAHVPNALKAAETASVVTGHVIPYLDSVGDLNKTRKVHQANKKMVLSDVAPLLAANKAKDAKGVTGSITNMFKTGYEGNLIIERALEEVKKITYHDLTSDATKLIPNITLNYKRNVENQLKEAQALNDAAAVKEHENKLLHMQWVLRGSGLVQTGADEAINAKDLPHIIGELSFGKTLEVRDYLHENGLDCINTRGSEEQVERVTLMVEDAFSQLQKEQGRRPLPTKRLYEVSKKLADKLVNSDLNALSLFNIIGRDELLNDKKDGFVRHEKVDAVIEKETKLFDKGATMDVEAFFNDVNYTLSDIQSQLKSRDINERALVVFLHDDPILEKAGMKKEEIQKMRAYISESLAEKMTGSIISALAVLPDKELAEKGYSEEDVGSLRKYAENPELLDRALRTHDHEEEVKNLTRTAVMGQGPGFIKEILEKGRQVADIQPRGPMDHAARESGDEMFVGG